MREWVIGGFILRSELMAIHVVTDSSSDIPSKLASEYQIGIVPLNVHFGEEVFKDGVDIWSEEFYHRLKNEQAVPNTSQPAPGEFLKVYQTIAKPGDTIISIHISGEMSGAVNSARIAAEMLGDEYQVIVIDSRFVSMVLGLIAIRAAKLAALGGGLEEILAAVDRCKEEIAVYFTVDSLEHLARTGRIGKATAFLGGLLNIKPILGISGGVIVPIEKIRGNFQKVAQQMVGKLSEKFGDRLLEVSIIHTELPDMVTVLKQEAEKSLQIDHFHNSIIGPIVGTHAGPFTIGIVALPL
jgi:DegV family protein with EDD domain